MTQLELERQKTAIERTCASANRIYIGYSGGIDSHVLLHLCAVSNQKEKVTAVYVNHGLQQQADSWAEHCSSCASQLGVSFRELTVNARHEKGESPEEAARNGRYQAFQSLLVENDVLLFAQHREDQMETVLLQLFRGAGLAGLSGMPEKMAFGEGVLLRPLLDASQQDIKRYALLHDLQWIEDPSNSLNDFDRNYLRNDIVPLIKQRWPAADKTISRSARHCAAAYQLISKQAEQCYSVVAGENKDALSIPELQKLENDRKSLVIRKWLSQFNKKMPSELFVKQVIEEVVQAGIDRNPKITWQGHLIRRFNNQLLALPEIPDVDCSKKFIWSKNQTELHLDENGAIKIVDSISGIAAKYWQQARQIQIRYRQGGESLYLPGRQGRHKLKNLFQEMSVPPWERAQIPLLYFDGSLAAVGEIWVAAEFYENHGDCFALQWIR